LIGAWRRPAFGAVCLLLTVVYLAYTVSVGGDFMGLHRFVMPLFVTTAVLTALGLEAITARLPLAAQAALGLLLVAGLALSDIGVTSQAQVPKADNRIDRPGYLKFYAVTRGAIGKALAPSMRPDDFAIFGGAGVQPYYARARGIDVYGLVSEDIAHNEPPSNPRPGHQKWASAARILKYNPSFIFSCYDIHKEPSRYHLNCGEAQEFMSRGYEPITIFVPGMGPDEYYTFLKRKDRPWR
jgi:hypothetical protein